MSNNFIRELLIFLLLIIGTSAREKSSNISTLSDGSIFHMNLIDIHTTPYLQEISIAAKSNVTFNITNVSSDTSFIIFQIHVYQYNVTLSYDKDHLSKVSNRSVFGSNIGLLFQPVTTTTQLFIENDNTNAIKALTVAVLYSSQAPVPGGCNMEFNTEIAPYMHVQTGDTMVIVDAQPASEPFNKTMQPICEKNLVDVTMYHMFLTEHDYSVENYFTAIISMLTVQDIKTNGYKVPRPVASTSVRQMFSAYAGIGTVYVAVATYKNHSAVYVPNFSYGCNPVTDPSSCDILPRTTYKIMNHLTFIFGLLLKYLAFSKRLKINIIMPMFFTGAVFSYAVGEDIWICLLIGVAVLLLWLLFHYFCPLIGKLIYSMTLGLLLSCIAYFYLPESFIVVQQDWIFWLLFWTMTLTISIIYMILCCGNCGIISNIFTSFVIVLSLDYYIGSCLKYIIINVARRVSVKDFGLANIQHPTQARDIWLIVLWILLALCSFSKCPFCRLQQGSSVERQSLLP